MIDIQTQFINQLLKEIEKTHKIASKETADKVLQEKKAQFDNYGRNDWDDEAFPPIKESTVRRKGGEDRPLLRTGRLKRSLRITNEDDFLSIDAPEVTDEYGRPYTQRAEDYITDKGGKHYFNAVSKSEAIEAVSFYISTFITEMKQSGF